VNDLKLHIGCGPDVLGGWLNIDKSPSALLARSPALRTFLSKAKLLTSEQARGFPVGVIHADASRRIPAGNATASLIYSSHMIEHLSRWQGLAFVRECRRVLRPGGLLRLATPDLEQLIRDYDAYTSPFLGSYPTRADAFCGEYGAYADADAGTTRRLLKKLLGGDSHQWLYDAESLSSLLSEGGFSDVQERHFREGLMPDLDVLERRERSLFMEAR
jgi:predicted SAM-dependent methyltransferase